MMRSISCGAMRAAASAARLASTPRSLEVWEGSAMWRWRMPVRVRIHSSEVSMRLARSSLVTIFSGRPLPVPTMRDQITSPPLPQGSCRRLRVPLFRLTEPLRQAMQHFVAYLLRRPLDGALESEGVGRAVALHDDSSQSEQGRAVEAARIEPPAERVERRH